LDPTGAGDRTRLISPYQSHHKYVNPTAAKQHQQIEPIEREIDVCTLDDGSTCIGWEGKMLRVSASMNQGRQKG
jgi:hypothetical protein